MAAAMGLSILSASPALAEGGSFANCAEALAARPEGAPVYTLPPNGVPTDADGNPCYHHLDAPVSIPPNLGADVSPDYGNQITQVPVGAPDTGAATEPTAFDPFFLLATAGAGVIAAGAFAAARRKAGAPAGSR